MVRVRLGVKIRIRFRFRIRIGTKLKIRIIIGARIIIWSSKKCYGIEERKCDPSGSNNCNSSTTTVAHAVSASTQLDLPNFQSKCEYRYKFMLSLVFLEIIQMRELGPLLVMPNGTNFKNSIFQKLRGKVWSRFRIVLREPYKDRNTKKKVAVKCNTPSSVESDYSDDEEFTSIEALEGWSDWSPCSRTCDGGTSFQIRKCAQCLGPSVRYRICNMQPCPDSIEFRDQQCAAYNDLPYDDKLMTWVGYSGLDSPLCELWCQSDTGVIAKMAPSVKDGTRCRPGSLDLCVEGQCQKVGCDLMIGSEAKVDVCGICGGDGSTCNQPLYHWVVQSASLCSATCGTENTGPSMEVDDTMMRILQPYPPFRPVAERLVGDPILSSFSSSEP
ncbi:unnamed protein product, partial [Nesidiocoris tenuis]